VGLNLVHAVIDRRDVGLGLLLRGAYLRGDAARHTLRGVDQVDALGQFLVQVALTNLLAEYLEDQSRVVLGSDLHRVPG